MPRDLLALPSVALAVSLVGCAAFSPVKNGMDEMQVEARMGKPDTVRKNSDGSETWEYPTGPLGRQTHMITVGSDHSVKDVRQVLSEEYFSKVVPGMSREEVRRLLGRPAETSVFPRRDEEVWTWRYAEPGPMLFHAVFDRSAGTVRTSLHEDENLDLTADE